MIHVQTMHTTSRLLVAEPGNGTRYTFIITPLSPAAEHRLGTGEGAVLVTLWPHDARLSASMFLRAGEHFAPPYLMEYLRLNSTDAQAVSDILHRELSPDLDATS